jgi:alkylation response protein AidB-like acyl-CoA dehydrogenase
MRFDATEEQQQLQATTRRFLEETAPLTTVRLWGDKNPAGFDRDWWRRAADLGWTSLLVPESQGGSAGAAGLGGMADLAIVAEERGRMVAPGPLLPVSVAAWTLAVADADSEAKVACQRTLEAILSGDAVCSWVVGEVVGERGGYGGGGDDENKQSWLTAPPPVTAVSRGTSLELTGTARALESGADSESFVVAVKMGDDVLHVLVPSEIAGLRRERVRSLDLVRRHADLTFDGVVVPAASVIVGAARGRFVLEHQRNIANIVQCAEMVGAAERAFEMTLEYTADRSSFGRPLASYQVLKHRLADMKLWIEASQAAVEGAVAALAAMTAGAEESASASQLVSAAKLYVGRKAPDIVQDCIQMHGGIGVTWEHDLHLYLRRVTTDRQLLGTPGDHALHLASLIGL